ncbi:helix-turn-helix transcriptional regulator [Klebsiella variicola]|uniref:helix-turn-helix transcriptional regulator n=1 Tax=Klebsiella variicola TaxID=244366 RepID=UPI000D74F4B9|nr:LuxR C-terminal-related transcriptional regulator [Klebsiella variicola]PXK73549.1 transcriptional regulator [Klebsiella variicola]
MKNFNVTINTQNSFMRDALVILTQQVVKEVGDVEVVFSYALDDYSSTDILIREIVSGEIFLCNYEIKNRKQGCAVILLHNFESLPEHESIVNCMKDSTFISLKVTNSTQILNVIEKVFRNSLVGVEKNTDPQLLTCSGCPHRQLSVCQKEVIKGISEGFGMGQIAYSQRVSRRTTAFHKNRILEKFNLNNNQELFHFVNLLRVRWNN